MGVVSLCDLLDDPGRLHFDSVDDVFVDLWFREPAPLPCKFPSVCQHLVAESTFVFRLVCVLWLAVLMEVASGHSTAFPVGHRVYRGCPCRDPPGVPQSPVRLFGKAPTLLGVVVGVLGVVTSGVHCARVPRVSRDVTTTVCGSCATEITHNPARLEALVKLSVVTILSHILIISTKFSVGLWVLSLQIVILFEISSDFSCLLSAVSQFILFTQMQICFFLGILINFECCRVCPWTSLQSSRLDTRCTSCQLCCEHFQLLLECQVSKGTGRSQRGRLCFRMKRR